MGQRWHLGGRGSSYNLWPAQCLLNLLNFFETAFRWVMPHSLCLHTVVLSSDCPLESRGQLPNQLSHSLWGWNPQCVLPRWLQYAAQGENYSPVILSHFTNLLCLAVKTLKGFVVAFTPACDSNSSPATFRVNLALIFLFYTMEIRMIYFIGIMWG